MAFVAVLEAATGRHSNLRGCYRRHSNLRGYYGIEPVAAIAAIAT